MWASKNAARYGIDIDDDEPWFASVLGDVWDNIRNIRGATVTATDLLKVAIGRMHYGAWGDSQTSSEDTGSWMGAPGRRLREQIQAWGANAPIGTTGSAAERYANTGWETFAPNDWEGISNAERADKIFALALDQWGDSGMATVMTAIALRESGGANIPSNYDPNSHGLWQINLDAHEGELIKRGIIDDWTDLYDPLTNARAAEYVSRSVGAVRDISRWSVTHEGNSQGYTDRQGDAEAARDRAGFGPTTEDWTYRKDSDDIRSID